MKTLTNSWLTARIEFDHSSYDETELIIDLSKFPVLLSPKKLEKFTIALNSTVVFKKTLKYTLTLKDASIDMIKEQCGYVDINFKLPMLQILTTEGNNEITFGATQEYCTVMKPFLLVSDCPVDILLNLSVTEGDRVFTISNVEEVMRTSLLDTDEIIEQRINPEKEIIKSTRSQCCKLSNGHAIRAVLTFTAPKLSREQLRKCVLFMLYLYSNSKL